MIIVRYVDENHMNKTEEFSEFILPYLNDIDGLITDIWSDGYSLFVVDENMDVIDNVQAIEYGDHLCYLVFENGDRTALRTNAIIAIQEN